MPEKPYLQLGALLLGVGFNALVNFSSKYLETKINIVAYSSVEQHLLLCKVYVTSSKFYHGHK